MATTPKVLVFRRVNHSRQAFSARIADRGKFAVTTTTIVSIVESEHESLQDAIDEVIQFFTTNQAYFKE